MNNDLNFVVSPATKRANDAYLARGAGKTYAFPVPRREPIWREDPTLPEGGYWDRFHTVNVTEEEAKRLQDDGLLARNVIDPDTGKERKL